MQPSNHWSYHHRGFDVHQLPALSDNYIYLIEPHNSNLLAAVDPAEDAPVIAACERLGKPLTHILNTHHHWDHTGANEALKAHFDCRILGNARDAERIPGIDIRLEPDRPWQGLGLPMQILDMPGHTLGHIALLIDDALFCGDTLFGAGCGRLFEGTPAVMWASLHRLAALDEDTRVYCAHEYTLANLEFALSIDAGNEALKERLIQDRLRCNKGEPTIPSSIGIERATNPFLRPLDAGFRTTYAEAHGIPDDALAVFTDIRARKDAW